MKVLDQFNTQKADRINAVNQNVDNFTLINAPDFNLFGNGDFKISLYILDGIEKTHRTNLTLKSLGLPTLDTSIYYKLLQTTLENKPLTEKDRVTFLELVQKLYQIQEALYFCDEVNLTPEYTLIGYVLGVSAGSENSNDITNTDEFGNLIYEFITSEINTHKLTENAKILISKSQE